MKCETCGEEISEEQKECNERIAQSTETERLDMCSLCWEDYVHHAITGD